MSGDLDQMIRSAIESTTERRSKGRRPKEKPQVRALPQVSLLPVEIKGAGQARRVRGLLVAAVALTAIVVGAGVALSAAASNEADARAAASNDQYIAVATQLGKFKDVQALQQRIALGTAAVRVGSSTSIDWQRWMGLLEADMPAGFTIQTVQADAATPFSTYPQGDSPLEKPRAAAVQITADAASLTELPVWLRKLKTLPAYADLSFAVSDNDTGHSVQVTVHLTTAAYLTPLKGK